MVEGDESRRGTSSCDVVVIGGGISGLGAAAVLADAGVQVVVLERAKDLGGRAWSFNLKGHVTNVGGPRAGLEGRRVDELFARAGREPGERAFFDGVVHHRDGEFRDLTRLAMGAPPEELTRFMAAIGEVTPADLPRLDAQPADEWLTGFASHPDLIDTARLAGIVLTTVPRLADMAASALYEALQTVFTIPRIYLTAHGYGDYMGILADVVTTAGGEVHSHATARRIELDGDAVSGVTVEHRDGPTETIACRHAVVAFPVWDLFSLVDPASFPAEFVESARHLERKTAIFGLTAATREPLYDHRCFVLTDAPRAEHPLSAFMASNVAPSLSPPGEHLFEACCQCDFEVSQDKAMLAKYIDLMKEDLSDMLPGWEEEVIWLNSYFHWVEPARTAGRIGAFRPDTQLPGPRGLWLVGDTNASRALPGLECAADSAMDCAERILSAG
jgi:phytoene dehydrogenase-like protein